MSTFPCPECGEEVWMTNKPILCEDCRRKNGLSPYDFIFVDIKPFVKGAKMRDEYVDMNGKKYVEKYKAGGTGFAISWAARGFGFSTTEFYIKDGKWYMEDEPYPDDFLHEAMKFFLASVEIEE